MVLDLLATGEVNLTAVRLLGPHLTPENHLGILESARGKRKAEVEEIVARLSPRAGVSASIRRLPVAISRGVADGNRLALLASPLASVVAGPAASPAAGAGPTAAVPGPPTDAPAPMAGPVFAPPGHARRSADVRPLSPDRYRYQLTIGRSTLEKLRLAKDLLRHVLPSGDGEAILNRALTVLLEDLARKKLGAQNQRMSPGKRTCRSGRATAEDSRHLPVAVKRAVWARDLGRCAFVAPDGRRCGERAFVEFHHVRPYAVGGSPTVGNIQLRCRRHNRHEANVFFAREPVDEGQPRTRTAESRQSCSVPGGGRSRTTCGPAVIGAAELVVQS